MSLRYCKPASVGFGVYEKLPPLAPGWEWVQSPKQFLFARSPGGVDHFVDFPKPGTVVLTPKKRATWGDVFRSALRLRRGQEFMDTRYRIEITSNQTGEGPAR